MVGPQASWMRQLWACLLDFLYPPFCSFCQQRMPDGERQTICRSCWGRAERWMPGACQRCGAELSLRRRPRLCDRCRIDDWPCADVRTPGPFSGVVAEAVHLLKYSQKPSIARSLAELMLDSIDRDDYYLRADMVLAVPLHPAKKRERGYNQADLIAKEVASALGRESGQDILTRTKHTRSQTKLNRAERQENVKDIFRVRDPDRVVGKTIILVDDVLTTGATIGSCARALKEAGAQEVLALTAAAASLD